MKYRFDKDLGKVVEKPEKERELVEMLPVPQLHGMEAMRLIEELKHEMIHGRSR